MAYSNTSKTKTTISVLLSSILMIFLTIILVPILSLLYIISVVHYRTLKLKYGNKICCPNGMDIFHGMVKEQSMCTMFATWDGKITLEQLKDHIRKVFQLNVYPIHSRRLRRYQQLYSRIAGYDYFIDDMDFDINNHFVQVTKDDLYNDPQMTINSTSIDSFIKGEDATDEFQVLVDHFLKKYGNTKMDFSKPLWQIFCYEDEDRTHFMLRFNHVMTDGIHFLRFLYEEFGDNVIVQRMPYHYQQPTVFKRYKDYLINYLKLPLALRAFLVNPGESPLNGPKIVGKKTRIVSEGIPLKDVKDIKYACKTSFNTVIFSCAAYAMRCHYRDNKAHVEKTYVVHPWSMQDLRKEIKTKNSHGMFAIMLTTETDDPEKDCALERLQHVNNDLTAARNDTSFQSLQLSMRMCLYVLPSYVSRKLFQAKGVSAGMSNIPGPEKEGIKIGDAYSQHMIFWLPDRDPTGMSISYFGNLNILRVGLQIDWGLMRTNKEAYKFLENFRKELYTLRRELGLDSDNFKKEISTEQQEVTLHNGVN